VKPVHDTDEIVGIDERIGASVPPATSRAQVRHDPARDQVLHERQPDAVEADHGDARGPALARADPSPRRLKPVEQPHRL
jgi:hypothetical protein